MDLSVKISRALPAPLPLAFPLAGRLAFRLRAELLVVDVPRMRPEPNPTVTTLLLSLRAHRLLPGQNREEYDNDPYVDRRNYEPGRPAATAPPTAKKEEDDPFGSGEEDKHREISDRRKKSHFKAASRRFVPGGRLTPLPMRGNELPFVGRTAIEDGFDGIESVEQ